jgi:hypothetical protein
MTPRNSKEVYVIRTATSADIEDLLTNSNYSPVGIKKITQNGGWIVKYYKSNLLVIPDYAANATPETYLLLIIDQKYEYKGTAYEGSDISQAINEWEFKSRLSPNTLDTFKDIIDEL